jgi:outer membrane protein assembly factor BamB
MINFQSIHKVKFYVLIIFVIILSLNFISGCDSVNSRGNENSSNDWITYQHDGHRSAKTGIQLDVSSLKKSWIYEAPQPPKPAWYGPAKWDAYANLRDLASMRNYDPVFHPIIVGDKLYYGSSTDDAVHCLDARTGKEDWIFTTNGPVRIAPTYDNKKLYFGSDDGYAYCINSRNGKFIWKTSPVEKNKKVLNDGRLISFFPVRTGILVREGTAYFGASLLPWKESYLCAVNARSGKVNGKERYIKKYTSLSLEGALLASSKQLIIPQGRISPLFFNRQDGRKLGSLEGGGGCFVLLTEDEHVLHGPGNKTGWITDSKVKDRSKLMTYENGNAIVVSGDFAYLLTKRSLSAYNRKTKKTLWNATNDNSLSLILAGDVLFTGGVDKVVAFDSKDGKQIWETEVLGKAYGLAVADSALFVSTDEGNIYCFRSGTASEDTEKAITGTLDTKPAKPSPPITPINNKGLVDRWVFQRNTLKSSSTTDINSYRVPADAQFKNLAGKQNATIKGVSQIVPIEGIEFLSLDGTSNSLIISSDATKVKLPQKDITIETWVNISKEISYGSIACAFQDNGNYERGWILGYLGDTFAFALASKNGSASLTNLKSKTKFNKNGWYHVVGTYDGNIMKIYVNGKPEASSKKETGSINYPPRMFYEIGAYHDDNEYFRMEGNIHEVNVYERALSSNEIIEHFSSKQNLFPKSGETEMNVFKLASGPKADFISRDSAKVCWQTDAPSPTMIEYGTGSGVQRLEDSTLKTDHSVILPSLRRNRTYTYSIEVKKNGKILKTRSYELDNFFNYNLPSMKGITNPFKDKQSSIGKRAKRILDETRIKKGICLVLGCGDGQLLFELAIRSDLNIIGIETEYKKIQKARRLLQKTGLYGTRFSIQQVDSFDQFPFSEDFANLIVAESFPKILEIANSAETFIHLLKPGGGIAYFDISNNIINGEKFQSWILNSPSINKTTFKLKKNEKNIRAVIERKKIEDAGIWSHQYGLPNNSAYGGEKLWGVSGVDDFDVQWLGRPGPRFQADRNGRKPSPLYTNGRMFVQGLERIIAIDAYNGTILWSRELSDFRRFNLPRDCSNWCADDNFIFTAIRDKCLRLNAATGETVKQINVLPAVNKNWDFEWGFIANYGNNLVGSAVKANTAYLEFFGNINWYDAKSGPQSFKVCSDNLFVLDKITGEKKWEYSNGVVINSTITIGNNNIYFVECRDKKVKNSSERRVGKKELWKNQFMVALNINTGKKLWETSIKTVPGLTLFNMAYANDKLVIVSSAKNKYHVYTYDAVSGKKNWYNKVSWYSDNHGGHMSRPAIVGDELYVRPGVFNLQTGERLKKQIPRHKGGCSTYACSENIIFFRSSQVTMWETNIEKVSYWDRLRPDCWLSTIPAGGMLLSPEGGGGCSCGSWFETSIAFAPKSRKAIKIDPVSSGFMDELKVDIKIRENQEGIIRYTLDGSKPDSDSPVYTKPLIFTTDAIITAGLFQKQKGTSNEKLIDAVTEKYYRLRPAPEIKANSKSFIDSLKVELFLSGKTGIIRYTLDGSEPEKNSIEYKKPVYITESLTLKARTFWEKEQTGKTINGDIAYREFFKIIPRTAENVSVQPGMSYDYAEGKWEKLPDFNNLNIKRSGDINNFDIVGRDVEENFAFNFYGYIRVETDGMYRFFTSSDDGSRLWIGEKCVVNNDGNHGNQERFGDLALNKGLHPIRVGYYQGGGGKELFVLYEGPGIKKQEIPGSVLFRKSEIEKISAITK